MDDIQRLKDAFRTTGTFSDMRALCPHCDSFADFAPIADGGFVGKIKPGGFPADKANVHLATCIDCQAIVVGVVEHDQPSLIYPTECWKNNAPPGVDPHSLSDYTEAIAILPHSPQCCGLLARRSLFRVQRTEVKVTWDKLVPQTEETIEHRRVTAPTRDALRNLIETGLFGPPFDSSDKFKKKPDPAMHLLPMDIKGARQTLQALEMLMDDLYREKIQRGWSRSKAA